MIHKTKTNVVIIWLVRVTVAEMKHHDSKASCEGKGLFG